MPAELSYAISKGALHQLTPTLADGLGARGITVNAVNPGPVDTGWPSEQWRRRLAPSWPSGRWGRPDDIAHVVAWLCSRESAWVTGNVIDPEGGFRDPSEADRVWVVFDWDEQGWQSFVSDPDVPAIIKEAGHKSRPQTAQFAGRYEA